MHIAWIFGMEHLSVPATLPHIVQVYQPTASVQPSIPNDAINNVDLQNLSGISQTQSVMQCQQMHLQNQVSQIIPSDGQIQITSHVIFPQGSFFKQHLVENVSHSLYRQYNTYIKETTNSEEVKDTEKDNMAKSDCNKQVKKEKATSKRVRRHISDPSQWKNNIQKERYQRGQSYMNRRGKFVPEKQIRNTKDCLTSCRYKCMEKINDDDRQLLFKAFYSLNANEKKHFLLNTTERYLSRNKEKPVSGKRNFSFQYFFLVRATRYVVCKNFYLGTLAISQKPVYNVHLNKSEANIPKKDGRGLTSSHPLPNEAKETIRKHIMSFKTIDSKAVIQFSTKRQHLDGNLNVKQMHIMYINECEKNGQIPLKESMYRKIFKCEFNLRFKRDKTCGRCKGSL